MVWFFPIVDNFPKYEKFVLCTQLKNAVINIARKIIQANKKKYKKKTLYEIDVQLEELELLIRFAHEMKYLSNKKYETASKKVAEVGRLLGGWIKSAKQ